jgi:methionine salvage enolase-phosphatase E1
LAAASLIGPVSEWVFINDNPIELRALAERYPEARMIRITRPDGKKFPGEDLRDVPTFTTLEEVRANLGL